MAESTGSGKDDGEPNLELPSLSLRRKKKAPKEAASPTKTAPVAPAATPEPAGWSTDLTADEDEPTPAPRPTAKTPRPAAARTPAPVPAKPAPPAPPAARAAVPPPPPPQASPAASRPAPPQPAPVADEAPAVAVALTEAARTAEEADEPRGPGRLQTGASAIASAYGRFADGLDAIRFREIPGTYAAIITGVVCGIVSVLLGWLAASGCDAVRGVGTCGGFGVIALVAIIAVAVLIGSVLLRAWRVSDPTSTAFLGVGLVAVFVMLFMLDKIGSTWMILVIPALSAVLFWFSWWVTAKIVATDD